MNSTRRDFLIRGGLAVSSMVVPLLRGHAAASTPLPGGEISGKIHFKGKYAKPAKVMFRGDDAYCRKFDLRKEDLLVGAQGGLCNVVVALEGIQGEPSGSALQLSAMAEEQCTFVPHVLSLTAGSKVVLYNRDPVLNTFHAIQVSTGRTLFNVGLPNKDQKIVRRIRQTGLIKMLCDVHPWELAYLAVFSHGFHTVSDEKGSFVLKGVPGGNYTLTLWHETLGTQRHPIQIKTGEQLKMVLSYGL